MFLPNVSPKLTALIAEARGPALDSASVGLGMRVENFEQWAAMQRREQEEISRQIWARDSLSDARA